MTVSHVCRGASPRARGNLDVWLEIPAAGGRIPACAGEPPAVVDRLQAERAHPRVRGGTSGGRGLITVSAGASPRARGNPVPRRLPRPRVGRIPACAGEPLVGQEAVPVQKAHPRVRGGTLSTSYSRIHLSGASPRARGNRARRLRRSAQGGRIPACAGEPPAERPRRARTGAHPRVRGGTADEITADVAERGASPRARGNRRLPRDAPRRRGRIPACAGEPPSRARRITRRGAHPRVRGGTHGAAAERRPREGASPRARGNHRHAPHPVASHGRIPACAGEPTSYPVR